MKRILTIGSTVALPKAGTGPPAGGPAAERLPDRGPAPAGREHCLQGNRRLAGPAAWPAERTGPGLLPADPDRPGALLRLHPGRAILEAVPLPAPASSFHCQGSPGTWRATCKPGQANGRSRRTTPLPRAMPWWECAPASWPPSRIQDRVFLRPDFYDPIYRARREGLFILAVNCLHPNATCFCASMGTGPRHQGGFDLCLTEMDDLFLVEAGSELGLSLLARRTYRTALRLHPDRRQAGHRTGRRPDGPQPGYQRPARPADRTPGCRTLGPGGQTLPFLRQLHPGLPDLFLLGCRRPDRHHRQASPAASGSGIRASTRISPTWSAGTPARTSAPATASG